VGEGNLNDFEWRTIICRVEWTEDFSEISQKLTEKSNLPGPWKFYDREGGREISDAKELIHGAKYKITRWSKMTLLLGSSM
jgi:hypothetical protein